MGPNRLARPRLRAFLQDWLGFRSRAQVTATGCTARGHRALLSAHLSASVGSAREVRLLCETGREPVDPRATIGIMARYGAALSGRNHVQAKPPRMEDP